MTGRWDREVDGLRDEGRAWAARVAAAGGQVDLRSHAGLIHGFIQGERGSWLQPIKTTAARY